jgi:hypothetical protein
MRERQAGGIATKSVESGTEFDFQASTSTFDKERIVSEVPVAVKERIILYKKDDFFDSLSSDNADRAEGKRTGLTPQMERALNQDTFGAMALQSGYRRGGFNGRGRGGGRGRGRGRTTAITFAP